MESLSRELLLNVDEEEGPGKTLKREPETGIAGMDATREDSIQEDSSCFSPVIKDGKNRQDGNSTTVIKSYPIDRRCKAQVVWDGARGLYCYELIEPELSASDRKTYERIVSELHKKPRSELATMKRIGGRERILRKYERLCSELGVSKDAKDRMLYFIERDFWGYKKIHGLLLDPNVEDVSCNGYFKPVYVYLPEFESIPSNVVFESEEALDDFIMYLVQRGGKAISAARPIQDVALPDGSRLNATLYREISSEGSTFSIRVANRARGAAELLRYRTFSPESMAFLWLAMENRCSMAFIGGTASGKTAALNAVCSFIIDRNKVVTIEDTREVRLSSQNWTPLVVRDTGEAPITEFDLLVTAFRQRPEYVIVGEVRTPEGARAAIHGINSGHTVSMTFHADSPTSFFNRLVNDPFNISPHVAASLPLCVSLSMVTVPSGNDEVKIRRCRSICEVSGVENGQLKFDTIFEWDPAGDAIIMKPVMSSVMERIRHDRGWNEDRLIDEIRVRTTVLRWMARNSVAGENQVRRVIEAFRRNRPGLLRHIESNSSADSIALEE